MKTIRITLLVLAGLAAVALAGVGRPELAGGAARPGGGGITVTGLGQVESVPDTARLTLGVQSHGATSAAVQPHLRMFRDELPSIDDPAADAVVTLGMP